jgi:hypothetical protein
VCAALAGTEEAGRYVSEGELVGKFQGFGVLATSEGVK